MEEKRLWTPEREAECKRLNREIFGDELREWQLDVLSDVDNGYDVLVEKETGSGKSRLGQILSQLRQKLVIVIEPLKIIGDTQAAELRQRFGMNAFSLNRDNSNEDRTRYHDSMTNGTADVVLMPPEWADTYAVRQYAALDRDYVIDEVHAVYAGRNSRAIYPQVGHVILDQRKIHDDVRLIGCSATISDEAAIYLPKALPFDPLKEHFLVEMRENFEYGAEKCENGRDKTGRYLAEAALAVEDIRRNGGAIMTFCHTIAGVDYVVDRLAEQGIYAQPYHGGMKVEERRAIEEAFVEGKIDFVVGTDAIGAGFHKPDVRHVLHFGPPKELETYQQQNGRGGRDGKGCKCKLFWTDRDFGTHQFFAMKTVPSVKFMNQVYAAIMKNSAAQKDLPHGVLSFNRSAFYWEFTNEAGNNTQRYAIKNAVNAVLNLFIEYRLMDVFNGCIKIEEFDTDNARFQRMGQMLVNRVQTELARLKKMHEYAAVGPHTQPQIRKLINSSLDFDGMEWMETVLLDEMLD